MAKDRLGLLLALSGLAIGVGGAIYLARHQGQRAMLGRVVNGRAPLPPLVGERREGGMIVRHYKSARMPIEQRVALIQKGVWQDVQDPRMRKLALSITRHCPERDKMCEAKAVYNYVKSHMRYTGDVGAVVQTPGGEAESVDLFQSAARSLEFAGGDCDDHVRVVSTLTSLNGIDTMMRVTSDRLFGEFGHIYGFATINGKTVPMDTTLPGRRFGFEVPFKRRLDFPV